MMTPASSALAPAAPAALLTRLVIAPYSVLGQQMIPGQGVVTKAEQPGPNVAFCDPAGLQFIQRHGPRMAGGASGALYSFLGIRDSETFPTPVRDAVTNVGLAKYHKYSDEQHCIHTVGPNFNDGKEDGSEHTREEAVAELAAAYCNVLREFAEAASAEGGPSILRLLPISGGIFAGPFQREIAPLTMDAIAAAEATLDAPVRELLLSDKVHLELCIFMERELDDFVGARVAALTAMVAEALQRDDAKEP